MEELFEQDESQEDIKHKYPITDYISEVYPILKHILYNITAYRTIISRIQVPNDTIIENPYRQEFFVNMLNNAIQIAIIDWCKIFGSEHNNQFHCRNHFDFTVDEQIRSSMIRFRNKFIAHKTDVEIPVPILEGAIEVMFGFDRKIRKEFDLDGYPKLKDWRETYEIRVEDLLEELEL